MGGAVAELHLQRGIAGGVHHFSEFSPLFAKTDKKREKENPELSSGK